MNRLRMNTAAAVLALGAVALAGCVPAAAHGPGTGYGQEYGHGQGYRGYGQGYRGYDRYDGGHYIPYGYEHYLYGRPYSYHSPRHYNPGYGYWPRPEHRPGHRKRADAAPDHKRPRKSAGKRARPNPNAPTGPLHREPGKEKPAFEALRIYPG